MCGDKRGSDWAVKGVAVAIVTLACLLHGGWRAGGIYINNFLAVIKVLVLVVVICAGFAAYSGDIAEPGPNAWEAEQPGPLPKSDPYGYAVAFLAVMFSYGGSMNANYVSPAPPLKPTGLELLLTSIGAERGRQALADTSARRLHRDRDRVHPLYPHHDRLLWRGDQARPPER